MTESSRSKTLEVMARAARAAVTNMRPESAEAIANAIFSHLQAEGMAVVPVAHLEPFAKYYRSRMAIRMRGVDDVIHRIHPGSEHEAEISVTDCGRLAAALSASPYGKAVVKEKDDE